MLDLGCQFDVKVAKIRWNWFRKWTKKIVLIDEWIMSYQLPLKRFCEKGWIEKKIDSNSLRIEFKSSVSNFHGNLRAIKIIGKKKA